MAVQGVDKKEQVSLTNLLQPVWKNVKSGIESLQLFSTTLQLPSSPTKYLQTLSSQAYQSIDKAEKELKEIKKHKQTEAYQGILKRKEIEDKIKECEEKLSCLKTDCSLQEDKIETKKYNIRRHEDTIYEEEQKLARIRDEYARKYTGGILLNAATGLCSVFALAATGGLAAPVVIPAQVGLAKFTYDEVQKLEEKLKWSRQELSCYKTQLYNQEAELRTVKQKLLCLQREDEMNRKTLSDLKGSLDIVLEEVKRVTNLSGYMSQICSFLQISGSRFQVLNEKRKEPIFASNLNLILSQIVNLFSNENHMSLLENTRLELMFKEFTLNISDNEAGEKGLDKSESEDMEGVKNVVRALNSGNERREMAMKQMEIDSNWGKMLHSAPNSVAVLGMLMALSTKRDFSLEKNIPFIDRKYVKHPSSFRASLVQISDDGCNSFTIAHKNMDKIYLYSIQFEQNVKLLVPILLKGSEEEKAELAPIFLTDMCKDAKTCLTLAKEIETSFTELTRLIQVISQAAAGAKGVQENEIKKCEDQKKVLAALEKEVQERKQKMEDEKKKIIDDINKAKHDLEEEFENLPSTGKNVLLSVIDTLTSVVSSPVAVIQGACDIRHSLSGADDREHERISHEAKVMSVAFENAIQIFALIEQIWQIVQDEDEMKELHAVSKDGKVSSSEADKKYLKEKLSEYKKNLDESTFNSEKAVVACRSLCKRGIAVCEKLMKESDYRRKDSIDKITNETKKLFTDAEEFKCKAECFLSPGSLSDTVNVTNQSKPSLFRKSLVETENENAMKKIRAKEKEYERIRKKEEQNRRELEELGKKNAKILRNMCKTDIQKIEFDKILDILNEGIKLLSDLKEQWSKIVLFFTSITNRIEICLDPQTQKLDKIARCRSPQGATKKIILEMAANINAVSCAVGQTAKCYTDISSKHLIGNIAGLSKMIGYDPEKDAQELRQSQEKLAATCEEANQMITKLVEERHAQTIQEIDAVYDRFESLEEQLLPIDENRKREIEHIIKQSDNTDFKEEDENSSDFV